MKTLPKILGRDLLRLFAVVLAVALGASAARAQIETPIDQTAPQKKVGTVAVKFIGIANVNEQIVRANIQLRTGTDYDEAVIDRDIRSLYRTGLFEFIEVKREGIPAKPRAGAQVEWKDRYGSLNNDMVYMIAQSEDDVKKKIRQLAYDRLGGIRFDNK